MLVATIWLLAFAAAAAEPLKVVLSSARQTYSMSDRATFQVALVNTSDEQIRVYRILQWGHAAGFVLHVFDENGIEVKSRFYDDYIPIPSTLNTSDSYIILGPDHLLGTLRTDELADWGVKPGSYTIEVEYQSPILRKYRDDDRFWSRDRGVLHSNRIVLQILP
jgi:hypothetical protein